MKKIIVLAAMMAVMSGCTVDMAKVRTAYDSFKEGYTGFKMVYSDAKKEYVVIKGEVKSELEAITNEIEGY